MESNTKEDNYSIFRSTLWLLFLTFGIQIIVGIAAAISLGVSGVEQENIAVLLESPVGLGIVSLLSAALILPMLKKVTKQLEKSDVWAFLGFKAINKQTLAKVTVVALIYYGLLSLILYLAEIPTPQFMLDIKAQTNTFFSAVMVITAICIVAPFMEEIVFRGVGYGRLKNTRIGVLGAIILPALLFTAIHLQYDLVDIVSILPLALLLGYVRYKINGVRVVDFSSRRSAGGLCDIKQFSASRNEQF